MPNPKMGTVTTDIMKAVKGAKAGSVQFRVEKKGNIQAGIGKISFLNEQLLDNIRSFMVSVSDAKPELYKGKFYKKVYLGSTMGPSFPIDVSSVDPSNNKFMLDPEKLGR
jgi:large subunit ribosomal protein L1